jgi:hypothetical protein
MRTDSDSLVCVECGPDGVPDDVGVFVEECAEVDVTGASSNHGLAGRPVQGVKPARCSRPSVARVADVPTAFCEEVCR